MYSSVALRRVSWGLLRVICRRPSLKETFDFVLKTISSKESERASFKIVFRKVNETSNVNQLGSKNGGREGWKEKEGREERSYLGREDGKNG